MIAAIRAEFRKIITLRSTYYIMLFCLIMVGLFAFYGQGLARQQPVNVPNYLQQAVFDAVNALGLVIALISVLVTTHEYRYNLIMYTFTSSNSRSKVLIAKLIAACTVSLVLVFLFGLLSPLATALGLHLKGIEMMPQAFFFKDIFWHVAVYGLGCVLAGMLFAITIRNQIGVLLTLLLYPLMVEPLLSLALRDSASYLPFLALGSVINHNDKMSAPKGAFIFLVYLVIGWIIGWIMYLRRDAN